jgi:hypothetical protein
MAASGLHGPVPKLLLDSRASQGSCVGRFFGLSLVQPPDQLRVVAQRLIPFCLVLILIVQCRLSSLTTLESASAIPPSGAHLRVPGVNCGTHHVRRGGPGIGRLELLGVEREGERWRLTLAGDTTRPEVLDELVHCKLTI